MVFKLEPRNPGQAKNIAMSDFYRDHRWGVLVDIEPKGLTALIESANYWGKAGWAKQQWDGETMHFRFKKALEAAWFATMNDGEAF